MQIRTVLISLGWILVVLTIIASAIYGDRILPDNFKHVQGLSKDQR